MSVAGGVRGKLYHTHTVCVCLKCRTAWEGGGTGVKRVRGEPIRGDCCRKNREQLRAGKLDFRLVIAHGNHRGVGPARHRQSLRPFRRTASAEFVATDPAERPRKLVDPWPEE